MITSKSELKSKNLSESMKILMLHEIRPFVLTPAENHRKGVKSQGGGKPEQLRSVASDAS